LVYKKAAAAGSGPCLAALFLQVEGAVNIAAIACGGFHNLALVSDGSVLSWGTNDYGQVRW
jgi:alpha-tubulin suppressor-like RCC1 family protein